MSFEFLSGEAGRLQVLVDLPATQPQALAVICHPHPLHGGSLTNKVVHQLARTFNQLDALSVRFNFRGVGESEGAFDEGRGEEADLRAVVAWARHRWPALPLWLAGFSFGGYIAMHASSALRPERLVTVAPAVNYFPAQAVKGLAADWLLIQGTDDEIVPLAEIQSFIATLERPPALRLIAGAGHFFHGRLNEVKQAILQSFE